MISKLLIYTLRLMLFVVHQQQLMLPPRPDVTVVCYCPCIWEFVHLPSKCQVGEVFLGGISGPAPLLSVAQYSLLADLFVFLTLSENGLQPAERKFCPKSGLMKTDVATPSQCQQVWSS